VRKPKTKYFTPRAHRGPHFQHLTVTVPPTLAAHLRARQREHNASICRLLQFLLRLDITRNLLTAEVMAELQRQDLEFYINS
jgi:hypothetical protein